MKVKEEKKKQLRSLIEEFFSFVYDDDLSNLQDSETIIQEINNLINRLAYPNEGISDLAGNCSIHTNILLLEYYESKEELLKKDSPKNGRLLARITYELHSALLHLENIIDLAEDDNESKYNKEKFTL